MPSNESSIIDPQVHIFDLPLTPEISTTDLPFNLIFAPTNLDPQVGDQSKRYHFRVRKQPDKQDFSNHFSNVAYLIFDFVYYHCLPKIHLNFDLQISSISITSHFQETLEDTRRNNSLSRCLV